MIDFVAKPLTLNHTLWQKKTFSQSSHSGDIKQVKDQQMTTFTLTALPETQ